MPGGEVSEEWSCMVLKNSLECVMIDKFVDVESWHMPFRVKVSRGRNTSEKTHQRCILNLVSGSKSYFGYQPCTMQASSACLG
jgi:hypothetical protein